MLPSVSDRVVALGLGLASIAGCKASAPPPAATAQSAETIVAGSASAIPPAASARAPDTARAPSRRPCAARMPFEGLSDGPPKPLVLPAPYDRFDPCEVLRAAHPDYDPTTERSIVAGGIVRARQAAISVHAGRPRLVLITYRGKEAEESFVGGCDAFHGFVSLLDRSEDGEKLVPIATAREAVIHGGVGSGLTVAPALTVREGVALLMIESGHSCGTSPDRTALHAFALEGAVLRPVFEAFVGARGMDRNAEIVAYVGTLAPTSPPRPSSGKDGYPDLTLSWQASTCPFDDAAGEVVCAPGKPLGTDTYRWQRGAYAPVGRRTKVPFL